jgi:muramoyltetrapeptide carboxypeptidase
MKLSKGDKVGIIACSDPLKEEYRPQVNQLLTVLTGFGLEVEVTPYLYETDSPILLRGRHCGEILMDFYRDCHIKAIFDVSGGNTANEILDYLDFDVIKKNPKPLYGYSDLTCVINGIYYKCGLTNILYQIKNICIDETGVSKDKFYQSIFYDTKDFFHFSYDFIQGSNLEGILIGGNIRSFLKLAGTPYEPDVTGKVLLLESLSGEVNILISFLNQLKQMKVFHKVNGIILGTFTEMDKSDLKPDITQLIVNIADNKELPIVRTKEIGHSRYSAAVKIGEYIKLK